METNITKEGRKLEISVTDGRWVSHVNL